MIKSHRLLPGLCFTWCLLSFQVIAEVPVVDDSENYAIIDDQQTALFEQSVAKAESDGYDMDSDVALAQDDQANSGRNDPNALLNKLQGLQQDLQELRGQIEVQAHDLKLLQQQQLAFYRDLDGRITGSPSRPVQTVQTEAAEKLAVAPKALTLPASPETKKPAQQESPAYKAGANSSRSNPVDEQISYLAAYDLVKSKRFDDALVAMQTFITQHPQGGYTANAHYWSGELYMVKNNYPRAIEQFEAVLKQFPSSSKAAASTLKIGYALAASGKENEAKRRLRQVVKNYPDTPTAQLAALKLESLGAS